ncbi:MAG: hypothetical protein AB8B51_04260 [Sedimentitalea sp.]
MGDDLLQTFMQHPVSVAGLLVAALALVWLKWHLIGRGWSKAMHDVYLGWTTPGEKDGAVTVMKPVGLLATGLWTGLFFAVCAVVLGNKLRATPNATAQDWAVFAASVGFVLCAIVLVFFSMTRLRFDHTQITRDDPLRAPLTAPFAQLQSVKPIGKTVMGGVILTFDDGNRIRVMARMSGYFQLLQVLAKHDPKLHATLIEMDDDDA